MVPGAALFSLGGRVPERPRSAASCAPQGQTRRMTASPNPRDDSRSEFLRIRGLRYHVRRWGPPDAPLIVAAHGWMDTSATFDRVARELAPRFQVLMPDWRGFGYTEWP